jgi:Holliday junction resolvasome RuvABC ATP-dependent DNA helicase subunit
VLEPYTAKELAEIINRIVGSKVSFEKGLLEEISGYVRRNARDADRMAKNVLSFGTSLFERGHFEILKDKLNLFPYGITHDEIRALKILQSDGECALGHLSSRLAQPAKAVQKSLEPYLIAVGLMEIDGKRRITGLGRTFLKGIGEGVETPEKLP